MPLEAEVVSAPTLSNIRADVVWLATRVEDLRMLTRKPSTVAALDALAQSLGRHAAILAYEIAERERTT